VLTGKGFSLVLANTMAGALTVVGALTGYHLVLVSCLVLRDIVLRLR
jgi:hypothetical protein